MEDLVSILMPFYNARDTLEECLSSILKQTWSNFELIAVDDGSEDDGPAVLSRFARDSRIKLVVLSENQGIVRALNHGLNHCRGKWIARMDADDKMRPRRLELQRQYFEDHPEVDILGAGVKLFRQDQELTPGQIQYQDWGNSLLTDEDIKLDIYAESPVAHPAFFLRKSFYDQMGGYRQLPWPEDYDFLLRACLRNARFAKLPQTLIDKGDSPTRLARVDPRCKRKGMFLGKAHFFARDERFKNKDEIIIIGSGASAKMAFKALRQNKVKIKGFAGNNPRTAGKTLAGLPVYTLDSQRAADFFSQYEKAFFLLCIGVKQGRETAEKLLRQNGLAKGKGYVRFI